MDQQDISRETVQRLLTELIPPADAATAVMNDQVRLHAGLAGLSPEELAKLAEAQAKPAKGGKTAKPTEA